MAGTTIDIQGKKYCYISLATAIIKNNVDKNVNNNIVRYVLDKLNVPSICLRAPYNSKCENYYVYDIKEIYYYVKEKYGRIKSLIREYRMLEEMRKEDEYEEFVEKCGTKPKEETPSQKAWRKEIENWENERSKKARMERMRREEMRRESDRLLRNDGVYYTDDESDM